MISRPTFKAHLHVEVIAPDRVFLLADGRHFALSGRAYALVAPLIDGRRTTDEIVDRLLDQLSPTEIYLALLNLERHGHVEEADASGAQPPPGAPFWHALGLDSRTVAERLAGRSVAVAAFGEVPHRPLRDALSSLGLRLTEDHESADLTVALTDDYLQVGLDGFNRQAIRAGKSWLLVKPNGLFAWLGPIFRPGRTGCWDCLAQRLRANREVEGFVQGATERPHPFPAREVLPTTETAALSLAATEVAKWVVLGENPALDGKVVTLDLAALRTTEHVLVRRPQCPACGDPAYREPREPAPLLLESRPKSFVADGGHRVATPEEMLRAYQHHISPITGVAKALLRVTDPADPLQHVYITGQNMAVRHRSFSQMRRYVRGSSCGKGMTDAQAQASGLGEAIERYSGVFRGDEIRERGSLRSLGDRAIDPRACMLFSEAQYHERERWNAEDRWLDAVPLPFDEEAELDWSPLWSLTRREFRCLPTSYCYYSYPIANGEFVCLPDSNGNAAGSTLEEAILQGFMELVERDAVALWWYNRLRRPALDLDGVDEPYVQNLRALHRRLDRDLWVLDLTSDLGIPAFIAVSRRLDDPVEDIVFAPAAHFDARLALIRALTELNQMMPGVARNPDGSYAYDDPEANRWWRSATLANQPYLAPAEHLPATRLSAFAHDWSDDLRDDVLRCQAIVEARGLELLVLDQTRPDVGLPVAKVVVPGLRHFWARFAPGRLYDVPVEFGWVAAPTPEADLNPVPIFI